MAIKKDQTRKAIRILKLCGLLLLPFFLFSISIDNLDGKQSICLIKNIFGHECYGCGITKSVLSAIQFDFKRAFSYNKLIVIVMPLLIYVWVNEIVKYFKKTKHQPITKTI